MKRAAFTLIELLVVVAVIGLLSFLFFPVAAQGVAAARSASCTSNLRQMQQAYTMYMDDHEQRFFPWLVKKPEGKQWYWGLEAGASGEGARALDRSRAYLAPYLGAGTVETCPDFPYNSTFYKKKFDTASYGYGLNVYLIAGTPENQGAGIQGFDKITQPSATMVWADAVQVNRFQAPASPSHPMLEEWYYVDGRSAELPKYHFRHSGRVNLSFADGSIATRPSSSLLSYCDGKVGYLEPRGEDRLLKTNK